MGLRAWMRRSKDDGGQPPRAGVKRRLNAVQRRNAAKGIPPRPPGEYPHPSREEQYNSDFITRYGDPFD